MALSNNGNGIDAGVRSLVLALNAADIDTDWSCSGEEGHMLIRPTIQARTVGNLNNPVALQAERKAIERVMQRFGIEDYWLLLNMAHGAYNTHGGEATWIIMIPGRFDLTTALPVAYDARFQTDEDRDPKWRRAQRWAHAELWEVTA